MDTDVPPILLPCAVCARTFMPQSLEKHSRICQQSANKRRKPFDSAKQRIWGTELAEFLPRQEKKRHLSDDKSSKATSTWKQTHDDFLQAIRAARNEVVVPGMQKQGGTTVTPNAPTRPNEQGTCPTCSRHFGVKAYERHVAWCKERIVRVTASPATNVAKERLDARMRYRAPAVKNRRLTTREKYSPGSAITLSSGNKTSPTLVTARAKESVSAPSCNKNSCSPVKQKIAVVRRPGQSKESSNLTVPTKYRSMDRGNRPPEDEAGPITFRPVKRISQLPVPPLKHKKESVDECNSIPSSRSSRQQPRRTKTKINRDDNSKAKMKQDEKYQGLHSARSQKANIVSARSQGNPKVNDVSINEEMMGVTVKPCYIYKTNQNQLTTWRQISEGKDSHENNCKLGCNTRNAKDQSVSPSNSFLDSNEESADQSSLYKQQLKNVELALGEEVLKEEPSVLSLEGESINWPPTTSSLNRTYSFRESVINGDVDDVAIARDKKWKPVRHSPRVEFCLGDPEKVSRVYAPPIGFGYPGERTARNDGKSKRAKSKEKIVEAGCSKHFALQTDRALDKVRSAKEDFNSEALLLETKWSSDRFEASSDRVMRATSCEDVSLQTNYEGNDQSCNNVEASQMYSKENNMADAILSNRECMVKETNTIDDEVLETVAVASERSMDAIKDSEKEILAIRDRPSNENLQSSTSFERFAHMNKVDDFFETDEPEWKNTVINNNDAEDTNEPMVDNIQLDSEEIEDCNNLRRESEVFVIDKTNSVESVQNEIECPAESVGNDEDMEFCDTEANWTETEIEPIFPKDTLQPTRSSTPFVGKRESSNRKCNAYENFKKELYRLPESSEWKMEVDTQTGSEILYRSESRDSNCSSSRLSCSSKIGELDKSTSDNDAAQYRNRSSSKHSKSTKLNRSPERISRHTSPTVRTERRIFSGIATSVAQKERVEESPRTYRKEIASQRNICKCSLKMCSNYNCERSVDEVCIYSARNESHSEEQVYDMLVTSNAPDTETVNKSADVQTEQSISETNVNSKRNESSMYQSTVSLQQRNHDPKKIYANTGGYNNPSDPPKFSMISTGKTEAAREDIEEIYKNYSNQDFDRDSDNSIEHHIKDAINGLKRSSVRNEKAQQNLRNLRSFVVSESCVKVRQRVRVDDSLTSRSTALKSRRSKKLEMESRSHVRVGALNGSSDSLPSSMDAVDLSDMKQVESVEVETIEEIGTRNRSIRFRILPEIEGTTVVVKENYNEREKIDTQMYWEKASKASRNRLINLDPPYQGQNRLFKRNPKIGVLPPVPSNSSLIMHRDLKLPLRPVWSNYVRRRPDFNLVLSGRTGKDYDPFLLAEQQMNDLLSDTSDQSVTDGRLIEKNRDSSFPLSHSSAFVKYPGQSSLSNPEKRSSLIAPPTEFDDLTSDFSSDSTETNSLSREVFLKDHLRGSRELKDSISKSDVGKKSPVRELGRRVIVDKSKALGGEVIDDSNSHGSRTFVGSTDRGRKILDKVSPKVVRSAVNRSQSIRAASAPKATQDRKNSNSSREKRTADDENNDGQRSANSCSNSRNNNYANLSGSNLSLSSIVSSDVDIKRSNSVFDELMTSFEDENGSFASLKTLLKNDSLSVSSPVHGRQRNGQISDEELSSPESYKRQDHSKMSGDSAYSSLNRKYSHHGRSTNDVAGRFDDDVSRNNRREGNGVASIPKCKMSKFCHECGSKFPETAKFCCECGIKRLML